MKKIILALAITAGIGWTNASAQEVRLENIDVKSFPGLKAAPDQETFYAVYSEDKKTDQSRPALVIYSRQMAEMKRIEIDVPKTATLLASCFSGEAFVLFYGDAEKKTLTRISIDRQGNVMRKQVEENVAPALLNPENYIGLYSLMPTEFMLVRTTGSKQGDFEIARFDINLEPAWKNTFKAEKGKMFVDQVKVINDVLFALTKETTGTNNDKTEYYVKAINLAEGKVKYAALIGSGSDYGLPVRMNVNDNMHVDASGVFFSEGDMDKAPDGLFWIELDGNGTPVTYTRKPWREIMERSKDKTIKDLSDGTLNILVEDRIKVREGDKNILIGELFEKTNGGAGTSNFAVKDFVVFRFSKEGDITDVERVEKTPKLAIVRGSGTMASKYTVAKSLYDKGFFTYSEKVDAGEKQNVIYRYNDGKTDKISILPISDSIISKKDIQTTYLTNEPKEETSGNNKKSKNTEKEMPGVTMEIDMDKALNTEIYNNIILLKDNQAMVQEYKEGIFKARLIGLSTK